VKELLKKIGITEEGEFTTSGNYVIDIADSDEFNKIFSKLDKSDLIEENEESSVINVDVSNVLYLSDEFALNLIADFKQDLYKLVVTDIGEFVEYEDEETEEE
jgi:hypothetical protein